MKKFSLILSIISLFVLTGCTNNLFKSGEWDKEGGIVYCESAKIGETKKIDGKEYTAVDREMLEEWIKNGKDLSKACTSNVKDMSGRIKWDEEKNKRIGIEGIFETWKSGVQKPKTVGELEELKKGFNEDISSWDVSNVKNMSNMFLFAKSFNQDIGGWDVSNVKDMSEMFSFALSFNKDIGDWDVSNVENMEGMFSDARLFNQDIGWWNVYNVKNMDGMFYHAKSFNQDIFGWNVINVKDMSEMFHNAKSFNQNIWGWDVSNVKDMDYMFEDAKSFSQDISNWKVSNVEKCYNFNKRSALSGEYIPEFENCDIDKSPY